MLFKGKNMQVFIILALFTTAVVGNPVQNFDNTTFAECYELRSQYLDNIQNNMNKFGKILDPVKKIHESTYKFMSVLNTGLSDTVNRYLFDNSDVMKRIDNTLIRESDSLEHIINYLGDFLEDLFSSLGDIQARLVDVDVDLMTGIVEKLGELLSNTLSGNSGQRTQAHDFIQSLIETPIAQMLGIRSMEKLARKFGSFYARYFRYIGSKLIKFIRIRNEAMKTTDPDKLKIFANEFKSDIEHINTVNTFLGSVSKSLKSEIREIIKLLAIK